MSHKNPYRVRVNFRDPTCPVSVRRLTAAVREALHTAGAKKAEIVLSLVGDQDMARLNERYLQHEGPTDVLTFADSGPNDDGLAFVSGEVVISVDTAAREALARGHGLLPEVALYAVHGALHLVGFNDNTSKAAKRMHDMEDRVLQTCGLGSVYARPAIMKSRRPAKGRTPRRRQRLAVGGRR